MHDHHYIGLVDEGVAEATRNPDLMSTDDFERGQIAQRDAERRSFKRAELQHELGHESNNLQVTINGRPWKVFPGRGYADSQQEFKFLQSMRDWAAKKSAQTGKKWTVHLTGAEPTVEAVDNNEQQLSELSNKLLDRYKKAAGLKMRDLDRAGKYKQADKHFSGVLKATQKQFDNDLKKHTPDEVTEARLASMKRAGYDIK